MKQQTRTRPLRIAGALALTLGLTIGGSVTVVSAASADTGDDVIQILQAANPETLDGVVKEAPTSSGDVALDAATPESQVVVPTDPSDGITISDGDHQIGVALPFAEAADDASPEADGIVSYDNHNDTVTVPLVKDNASVQITTIIETADAPPRYDYPVTVPAGGSLSVGADGLVSVLDSAGGWVAGFAPAWAKDSNGIDVPTHYEVNGTTLVQVVDFTAPGISFPVVADPWLGIDLIDHTTWNNTLWQYSPTLQVYPTWWGRYGAGIAADGAAWSETLSKTSRTNHPNPNTASMQVQFDCHFQVVRIKSPNKPSWNLDSKLPWTDFANEVRYGCNYPTGNREF